MGTGSGGGGGSGTGRGGGGGGIGSGAGLGGYRFEKDKRGKGRIVRVTIRRESVQASIQNRLRKIPSTYLKKQFGSPLVRSIYRELCTFKRWMDVEDPCADLVTEYKIKDGPGFLVRWVSALITYQHDELNEKMRATARMTAEDFLIRALNDDLDLYILGTCAEVLSKLDQRIFQKTSRHFLGSMIWRVLEREYERQPTEVQKQIKDECQELADQAIKDFVKRFVEQGEADDCDLFEIIEQEMDWFVEKLREEARE